MDPPTLEIWLFENLTWKIHHYTIPENFGHPAVSEICIPQSVATTHPARLVQYSPSLEGIKITEKKKTGRNKSGLNTEIPSAALISMQHKIVKMLDPQSHHNPQPKRSSSSGTLNMIPLWNIHTVKQSMPRSCSNGCSLNWFTPSEFFQFSQLSNQLVSLKNANDVHKRLNLVWVWN